MNKYSKLLNGSKTKQKGKASMNNCEKDDGEICCPKCKAKSEISSVYHGGMYGNKLNVLKPKFPKSKKFKEVFDKK